MLTKAKEGMYHMIDIFLRPRGILYSHVGEPGIRVNNKCLFFSFFCASGVPMFTCSEHTCVCTYVPVMCACGSLRLMS